MIQYFLETKREKFTLSLKTLQAHRGERFLKA